METLRCFNSDVNSGSSQEKEEDTLLKEKTRYQDGCVIISL